MRFLVSLGLLLSLCTVAAAELPSPLAPDRAADLALIQANIERLGLPWRAGDNPVFRLPAEARRHLNGSPAPTDWRGPVVRESARVLPLFLDWRDNGGDWVTKARNQGSCGSCWVFSSVAALESCVMIASGVSDQTTLDLSEQYVLSCITQGDCRGGWCQDALDFMLDEGVCDEACFPYEDDDAVPCAAACAEVDERLVYVDDIVKVTHGTIDPTAINQALQDGPLVTNFTVYEDFYAYVDGIYVWDGTSPVAGGHSVAIVGYDNVHQAWLAKNSWGRSFGDLGCFWIAYDSGTGFGADVWRLSSAATTSAPTVGLTALREPAPNPANPGTSLGFSLAAGGEVELGVYDLAGRRVADLARGWFEPGAQRVDWDGRDLAGRATASGTYLVRLRAPEGAFVRKLTIVR